MCCCCFPWCKPKIEPETYVSSTPLLFVGQGAKVPDTPLLDPQSDIPAYQSCIKTEQVASMHRVQRSENVGGEENDIAPAKTAEVDGEENDTGSSKEEFTARKVEIRRAKKAPQSLPPPSPAMTPQRIVFEPNELGLNSHIHLNPNFHRKRRIVTWWTLVPRDPNHPPSAKQYYLDSLRQFSDTWTL